MTHTSLPAFISPAHILVVDDEPLLRQALAHILRKAGHHVTEAERGEEAWELIQNERPELVVLDVVLPDMTGTELCRRIRKMDPAREISVVLISGIRTATNYQAQGLEAGADEYIIRPISNRELEARITTVLQLRHVRIQADRHAREQEIIADLGRWALRGMKPSVLMQELLTAVARHLHMPYGELLRLTGDNQTLMLEAAYGWDTVQLGKPVASADVSPFSTVLNTTVPLILSGQACRQLPPAFLEHAPQAGVWVVIPGEKRPFGLLGFHTDAPHTFATHETQFLQTVTTTLASVFLRQQAENILRQSEERYRIFTQLTADAAYVLHVAENGRFTFQWTSDTLPHITGHTPKEIENLENWQHLIHPEDLSTALEHGHQLRKGQPHTAKFRILTKQNTYRWIESIGYPETNPDSGQVTRIYGAVQDITTKIRHQEEDRLFATVYQALSNRRPGEGLHEAIKVLGRILPIDAAALFSWQAGEKALTLNIQWIRPDLVEKANAFFLETFGSTTDIKIPLTEKTYGTEVFRTGQPIYTPDLKESPNTFNRAMTKTGARTMYTLPINTQETYKTVLTLFSIQKDAFDEQTRARIDKLLPTLASVLEAWRYEQELAKLNARLEEHIRRRTHELETLYALSQEIGYTLDYGQLAELIVTHLYHAIPYDTVAFLLETETGGELAISISRPVSDKLLAELEEQVLETFTNLGGTALRPEFIHRQQVRLPDFQEDLPELTQFGSSFYVPVTSETSTVGVLLVANESRASISHEQVRLLYTVANQTAVSLERLQAILAAEQRRLESLLANLPLGVILLNEQQQILVLNRAARDLLKKLDALEATNGRPLTQLGPVPVSEILEQYHTPLPTEIRLEKPSLSIIEVYAHPLEFDQERQWILVLQDVTEEHELQVRLQTQERLATVGQLAAGIAHDFNNILAIIILYSQLLRETAELSPRNQERLKTIDQQSHRAANLIRQILDFSRQSVMEPITLDLVPFLKELRHLLQRTLPENIHVELNHTEDTLPITADPTRLQQVLMNLAINARDAMPNGGTLQIDVGRFQLNQTAPPEILPELETGDWIVLRVSDTGVGIPPEIQPRIFEPFFTTKSSGQGTGLGLAQVYGIVKQHGGHIHVISRVGEGTTFELYFPVQSTLTALKTDETESETMIKGDGRTILIVEDNQDTRSALRETLENLNYHVLEAKDGEEALAILDLHGEKISLILSDIVMPRVDGLTLFQHIKKEHPGTKMILVTGYPLNKENQSLLTREQVQWLQKPITSDKLLLAIQKALSV